MVNFTVSDSQNSETFEQAMVPASLFKTGFVRSVYSGQLDTTIKEMYSILVVNVEKGFVEPIIKEGLDPHAAGGEAGKDTAEHFFSVPPKVIEVTEPYTTKVVPTQNGGKFVESHGVIIREIRVQGTSGLRPNKPLPASVDLLGGLGPLAGPANALAGPIVNRASALVNQGNRLVNSIEAAFTGGTDGQRPLNPSERTGYDDIMKLRNIFRLYSDMKNSLQSSRTLMLWRNVKDADYWVVEPTEFKLVQDSKSPLTYNYIIALKTISRLELAFTPSRDPLASIRSSNNMIAEIQRSTRELTNTLLVVSTQVDRLAGAGVFAQNLILSPVIDLVRNASSVAVSLEGFGPSLKYNWQRLHDNLQEASNTLDNHLYGDTTPGVSASVAPLTQEAQDQIDSYRMVHNSIRSALRATRRVLNLPIVRTSIDSTISRKKQSAANAYKKLIIGGQAKGNIPKTAGDLSYLGNELNPGSVATAEIGEKDTLRSLAARLLGSRNRWQILALLNNLRAPYITTTGEPQTLRPGDFILYPVKGTTGITANDINRGDSATDIRETAIERAYGRDIRLKSRFDDRSDLVIENGDLTTIVGIPNVKQGIRLKLITERGELTVHPYYGAAYPIGTKGSNLSFNAFRINTYSTILSDTRIIGIKRLDFLARGDILSIGADLVLKPVTNITTTEFSDRSF